LHHLNLYAGSFLSSTSGKISRKDVLFKDIVGITFTCLYCCFTYQPDVSDLLKKLTIELSSVSILKLVDRNCALAVLKNKVKELLSFLAS